MRQFSISEIKSILEETADARFVFDDSDRQRVLSNPHLEAMRERLIRDGDELRGTPIIELPFSSFKRHDIDGNRTEFEDEYFKRRHRLLTFALLSWLYGREEDIRELENIVWAILNEYTWAVPAHLSKTHVNDGVTTKERVGLKELQEDGYTIDLFAAETASALAETLSLMGDKLTPILVKRTELYIKKRIFDCIDSPYFNWKHSVHNWSAVCGGSCGIAAIYVERDTERLAKVISIALESMASFCKGYTADGACLEGMSYWLYGFGYFTYFADLLKRRTQGKINLFDDEKIEKMAAFPQKCFVAGAKKINFSDTGSNFDFPPALSSFLATEFDSVSIPPIECIGLDNYSDYCARFALGVRDFIWTDEAISNKAMKSFGANQFPCAGWYIASSKNGVGIAAKAGFNGEPHNHNDTGSFHVFKNGNMTLADVGSGEYRSQYFGPERYTLFPTSSASHNVPIINGKYQAYGTQHASRNVVITEDGISSDISAAYDDETLRSLKRSISFDRENGVIDLVDEYKFSEAPISVTERFVSFEKPILENGRITIGESNASFILYDEDHLVASVALVDYSGPLGKPMMAYTIDLTVKAPTSEFALEFKII